MSLLSLRGLRHGFGGPPLFSALDLQVDEGDRLCLLGRNGTGKSTLLEILAGTVSPEAGERHLRKGLRLAFVPQEVPTSLTGPAWAAAAGGHTERETAARRWCSLWGLDPEADCTAFSGGQKRRVLLARALAAEPELLLLDEPTNHLDLAAIQSLEAELSRPGRAVVFITHDRAFARRVANRCAELDRGGLLALTCGFDEFLRRRDGVLEAREREEALFDKRLAAEEVWVRRGVKARLKRNEGRVKALERMRQERAERRQSQGQASLKVAEGPRSGDLVLEAKQLSFAWPGRPGFSGWDFRLERGDKVALMGPNGGGKTTLLRLLLGQLSPAAGQVRQGAQVQAVYFDQLRSALDPEKTLIDTLGEGYDQVEVEGRSRHVLAYLQDYLFDPDRARVKVGVLSGGEQNRLLLALLFKRPANLLVLDEPTNDLDLETLEMLEQRLVEFPGAVLISSHDREFVDRCATSTLWCAEGRAPLETVGGWTEAWQRQQALEEAGGPSTESARGASPGASPAASPAGRSASPARPAKLSFRETQELEALPARLEGLEAEKTALEARLADPSLYKPEALSELKALQGRLPALEAEIAQAYARWEALDAKAAEAKAAGLA